MRIFRLFPFLIKLALVVLTATLLVSFGTGIPIFTELKERAKRYADRKLPGPTIAQKSRAALTARLEENDLKLGSPVFIRIFKEEAALEVWLKDGQAYRKLHSYPICKFSGFLGPKLKEGDRQAPEGFYSVTAKQLNPGSRHYKAFNLGFPNEYDRAHGRTGSALMVHGGCTSIGCYAMTDLGVAEIYRLVERALKNGQKRVPVHVFPFRMTLANMDAKAVGPWRPYWENLKEGHDLFEASRVPPQVGVCGKRYAFNEDMKRCKLIAGW